MNKITCICLGVKDMERSIKFYRDGLGYKTDCRENNPSVCFFDTPGTKFELFPLEQLAKDIDENNPPKVKYTPKIRHKLTFGGEALTCMQLR